MKAPYIESINFNKTLEGFIPAIIQDANTLKVLMLGFMNEETYLKSIQSKKVTFYSRSKKRKWIKGEETTHYLVIKEIFIDCDRDSLLIKVIPMGPTCHIGTDNCWGSKDMNEECYGFFRTIEKMIFIRRKLEIGIHKSYIRDLFENNMNKIIQKVGEEAVELIISSKDSSKERFLNEAADLLFHYLVLIQAKNFNIKDILYILKKRQKI
jgi:phosphoribosyl-ATP pyrophosphohydrolase/phosphoribosyl-AMP cyclohydrolase